MMPPQNWTQLHRVWAIASRVVLPFGHVLGKLWETTRAPMAEWRA